MGKRSDSEQSFNDILEDDIASRRDASEHTKWSAGTSQLVTHKSVSQSVGGPDLGHCTLQSFKLQRTGPVCLPQAGQK